MILIFFFGIVVLVAYFATAKPDGLEGVRKRDKAMKALERIAKK